MSRELHQKADRIWENLPHAGGSTVIRRYLNQIYDHEECVRDKPVDRTATCRNGKVPKLDCRNAADDGNPSLFMESIRRLYL